MKAPTRRDLPRIEEIAIEGCRLWRPVSLAMHKALPTVADLNSIQHEWMALSSEAPAKEKSRVFALFEQLPKSYLSSDGKVFTPMVQGGPVWHSGRPLAEAIKYARAHGIRVDVAWSAPRWVALPAMP